jgi:metal-dependent amidase/aminoacylase/carboxypeptidase family protein
VGGLGLLADGPWHDGDRTQRHVQHLPENANTNALISHGGGATNVIAGDSTVQVEVRAGDVDEWRNLKRRVLACFEGAAIATECT